MNILSKSKLGLRDPNLKFKQATVYMVPQILLLSDILGQ